MEKEWKRFIIYQHLVFNIFSFFQIFSKYDELELGSAKK